MYTHVFTPYSQLLLALAHWLCEHYETDHRARSLVNHVHLHLMPTMNPDGFALHTRNNMCDDVGGALICHTCNCMQCMKIAFDTCWYPAWTLVHAASHWSTLHHVGQCCLNCVQSTTAIVPSTSILTPHCARNDVDLNRNFPDPIQDAAEHWRRGLGHEQPETRALMNWTLDVGFTAAAALHEVR